MPASFRSGTRSTQKSTAPVPPVAPAWAALRSSALLQISVSIAVHPAWRRQPWCEPQSPPQPSRRVQVERALAHRHAHRQAQAAARRSIRRGNAPVIAPPPPEQGARRYGHRKRTGTCSARHAEASARCAASMSAAVIGRLLPIMVTKQSKRYAESCGPGEASG